MNVTSKRDESWFFFSQEKVRVLAKYENNDEQDGQAIQKIIFHQSPRTEKGPRDLDLWSRSLFEWTRSDMYLSYAPSKISAKYVY